MGRLTPEREAEIRELVEAGWPSSLPAYKSHFEDARDLLVVLDEARAERDSMRESAKLVMKDGMRHMGARQRVEAERDRLAAACAAKDVALRFFPCFCVSAVEQTPKNHPCARCRALSSDAGKDWVSPSVAEQAEKALRYFVGDKLIALFPHEIDEMAREVLAALEAARK
jgi:hypothetical protein